jgi:hypothetical protein
MSYRRVLPSIWDDEDFVTADDLDRSVYLLLLIGPQVTALPGLQHSGIASLAETLRRPVEAVAAAMKRLSERGFAHYDDKKRVICLPSLPASNPAESPNHIRAWWSRWNEIPDCPAKYQHVARLKEHAGLDDPKYVQAWQATFGTIEKSVTERLANPAGDDVERPGTLELASSDVPPSPSEALPEPVESPAEHLREPSTSPAGGLRQGSRSPPEGLDQGSGTARQALPDPSVGPSEAVAEGSTRARARSDPAAAAVADPEAATDGSTCQVTSARAPAREAQARERPVRPPSDLAEALLLPLQERAEWCVRRAIEADYWQPWRWPEVGRAAEAVRAAFGLAPLRLGTSYQRDSGLRAIVELYAASLTPEEFETAAALAPADAYFQEKRRRGLASFTPEVVRRLLASAPQSSPSDEQQRRRKHALLVEQLAQQRRAERSARRARGATAAPDGPLFPPTEAGGHPVPASADSAAPSESAAPSPTHVRRAPLAKVGS